MAEGILKAVLPNGILEWTIVRSAGTLGLVGAPASGGAVRVAAEKGVDIAAHRSSACNPETIDESDLILTMEPCHSDWIVGTDPGAASKTHLLGAFVPADGSPVEVTIGDPIGGIQEVYKDCFRAISGHIERALPALEELVRQKIGRMAGS